MACDYKEPDQAEERIFDFSPDELLLSEEYDEELENDDLRSRQTTAKLATDYLYKIDKYHGIKSNPCRPDLLQKLPDDKQKRFDELEAEIDANEKACVATAIALLEIRLKRLYWFEWNTFQDYVEKKWEISRARAYQLTTAAVVYKGIVKHVNGPCPWRISHLLALRHLKYEEAVIAYDHAYGAHGSKMTAGDIIDSINTLKLKMHKEIRERKQNNGTEGESKTYSLYFEKVSAHVTSIKKVLKEMIETDDKKFNKHIFKDEIMEIRELLQNVMDKIDWKRAD